MFYPESFKVTTPSDLVIQIARDFHAPRQLVFDAFTKPELVRRWLLGPPGWSMPVCEIDLKVGGSYRYTWRHDEKGTEMGVTGVFTEIAAPARVAATEKSTWAPEEVHHSSVFKEFGALTRLTMTMLFESKDARDNAQRPGMDRGIAMSYSRLEELLAAEPK